MMNIQIGTFFATSEKNWHGKILEKLLKMFFMELMLEYFTGGNILWGISLFTSFCPGIK